MERLAPRSRPRLLPGVAVLRRGRGELQLGTSGPHAVVLTGLPDALADLLGTLDGRRRYTDLLDSVDRGEQADLVDVLHALFEIGLAEDAALHGDAALQNTVPPPGRLTPDVTLWSLRTGEQRATIPLTRSQAAVVVRGDGRIAIATACLLAASGVGWVQLVADGVVRPEDTGCGYLDDDVGRRRETAGAEAIQRCGEAVRTAALPPGRPPDLVVLADATVVDPALSASLIAAGTPHLLVRGRESAGCVGPLVLPGRTSCLHCLDLHRTDGDPEWPRIAPQLVNHVQQLDLACAQATAAFAVGQVLHALHRSDAVAVCDAAIDIDVFGGLLSRRTWTAHPSCDCGGGTAPHRSPEFNQPSRRPEVIAA
ncbi:MAG: hypothetical protein J2O49_00200 [Sciscionella sp.]|nr:hypothetical protein [Sciscionella sp.]